MGTGTQQIDFIRRNRCRIDSIPILGGEFETDQGGRIRFKISLVSRGTNHDEFAVSSVSNNDKYIIQGVVRKKRN